MQKLNTRRRETPTTKRASYRLHPRDHEIFRALAIHGDLPISYLYAMFGHLWTNKLSLQNRLTRLFHDARLLDRHSSQFDIGYNRDLECYYRLNDASKELCRQFGIELFEHDGWFKHQQMTAATTASVHIAAKESYTHLHPGQYEVQYGDRTHRFRPDAMFAITLNGKRRIYVVEVDRNTEQNTNTRKADTDRRKSLQRLFNLYRLWIGTGQYKKDLNTNDGIVLLFATSHHSSYTAAYSLIEDITDKKGSNYMALTFMPEFATLHQTPPVLDLYTRAWTRVAREPYFLNT